MNILLITDFFPPHPGGMKRHVKSLAHHLRDRGHAVSIALAAGGQVGDNGPQSEFAVYSLTGLPTALPFLYQDPNRRYAVPARDPVLYRSLRRLVDHVRPDVVHSHGWNTFTTVHLGIPPLVVTLHDYGLFCPKRTLLRPDGVCGTGPSLSCIRCGAEQYGLAKSAATFAAIQLSRSSLPKARYYMADSTFLRDAYLRFTKIRSDQMVVVPGFHSESEVEDTPGEQPIDLPLPPRFILYVGNLTEAKGVHVLLDAYRRLDTDVPLVLIGPPREPLVVTDPRVTIIEGVPHPAAMEAMARCLFVVVPSIWPEPFGLTAIEAMRHGKPVIASSTGGLLDIVVHGGTGLLVPPADAESLAGGIAELLADANLRQRLGAAGERRLRDEFSAEAVVPRIESVYRRAIT